MRQFSILAAGAALAVTLTACGSSNKTTGGGADVRKVPFTLTDAGCDPAHLELPAGAATFEVKNDGADAVTEMEIQKDGRILGEVENITPGLTGDVDSATGAGGPGLLDANGGRLGGHAARG